MERICGEKAKEDSGEAKNEGEDEKKNKEAW